MGKLTYVVKSVDCKFVKPGDLISPWRGKLGIVLSIQIDKSIVRISILHDDGTISTETVFNHTPMWVYRT